MESQFRSVIRQKILDDSSVPLPKLTPRDVWMSAIQGKARAIIGMRRAGRTSFLWQLLSQ